MTRRVVPLVIWISALACIAFVLWAGRIVFLVVTQEEPYAKYSPKYWIAMPPAVVRDVPLVEALDVPEFFYSPAWAIPNEADYFVIYHSKASEVDVLARLRAHAYRHGWRPDLDYHVKSGEVPYIHQETPGRLWLEAMRSPAGTDVSLLWAF